MKLDMAKTKRGDTPLRRVFRLFVLAAAIIIMIFCAFSAYKFGIEIFSDRGVEDAPGTDKILEIKSGTSMTDLGKILEDNGVIKNRYVFFVQSKVFEVSTVQAGDYKFNTSQSGEQILDIISAGPNYETEDTTENQKSKKSK